MYLNKLLTCMYTCI